MITNIIKNPVIIGLVAAILTYVYLLWRNKRKIKKNPRVKKNMSLLPPLLVGVIVWFIAYGYFEQPQSNIGNKRLETPVQLEGHKYRLSNEFSVDSAISESSKSYHLIGKGLTVPNGLNGIELPDVFIHTT
jgi:hypothetical protein